VTNCDDWDQVGRFLLIPGKQKRDFGSHARTDARGVALNAYLHRKGIGGPGHFADLSNHTVVNVFGLGRETDFALKPEKNSLDFRLGNTDRRLHGPLDKYIKQFLPSGDLKKGFDVFIRNHTVKGRP